MYRLYEWQVPSLQSASSLTNRRKDSYGGSISNRAKFHLAVVESIKKVIGNTP